MKFVIEAIPHSKQRYNTCGDWQWIDKETLSVKISEMKSTDLCNHFFMEAVIGIHELVEALQCRRDNISEEQVDAFDTDKKMIREVDKLGIESGDHPNAPYKQQHTLATGVERILCFCFGIPWFDYENQLVEMTEQYEDSHGKD